MKESGHDLTEREGYDDILRGLPDEYIRGLPEPVQSAIRQRLAKPHNR